MNKEKLDAFRRLNIRIDKSIRKAGKSPEKLTTAELTRIMVDAKIMNEKKEFLDETGYVITFV